MSDKFMVIGLSDSGYLCPAVGCPGTHRSKREICVDRELPAVQTPSERPGYFRGAKISKPVNRGQKS